MHPPLSFVEKMAKLRLQVLALSLEISLVSKGLLSHLLRCLARRHCENGFFVGCVFGRRVVFKVGEAMATRG